MKDFLPKNLMPPHAAWLSLVLIFTLGICLAQETVDTGNYQVSAGKKKEKGQHWGVGMTVFSGYGRFTGDLRKIYKGYLPIGVSVDVYYRKLVLGLGMLAGYGRTQKDILYDTAVWEEKDWYELLRADLALGFIVENNESFKLTPFAGISFLNLAPATEIFFIPDDEPSPWDDVDFNKARLLTLGLTFDAKVGYREKDPSTFWSLRLQYSYSFPIGDLNNGTDGGMHTFTIGINYLFIEQK